MTKVLFIVPYEELFASFYNEVNKYKNENIRIEFDHIYGTDIDKLSSIDADVIVTRGITALAVAKYHPNSLVIPIPMSPNDFVEAIYSVCMCSQGKVGILAGSKSMCNPSHVSDLIGREVSMFVANTQEQVRIGIDTLAKENCKVFVGGLTMCRICEELSYPYVHVKTGQNAIQRVVSDALSAARSLEQARIRVSLLSNLLSNTNDIIIAVNSKGNIIASNDKADEFFGRKLENIPLKKICSVKEIFRSISVGIKSEFIREVNNQLTFITVRPMNDSKNQLGFMIRFHKVEDILNEESKVRKELLQKGLVAKYYFKDFLTKNTQMRLVLEKAKSYSIVDGSIILIGETGTGKELIAQSIHNASGRKYGPFVAVNCATLTAELLESELFGYERGAFTGARKEGKIGLFELAHGGTIFLDEIGEMPNTLQAKLLRVLQEKEIRRIGGDTVIPIDVRVISATNVDIYDMVKTSEFRLDLFYRLGLFSVHTIALRERIEDISLIFKSMYIEACSKYKKTPSKITREAYKILEQYQWPGNVRELKNSAERLAVLNNSDEITFYEIERFDIIEPLFGDLEKTQLSSKNKPQLSEEKLYELYVKSNMSKGEFAKSVGLSRSTLWRKISKFES